MRGYSDAIGERCVLTQRFDREPLNICVIRDSWFLCYGELLERAFRKQHCVLSIVTDGWSERIALQVKAGRTMKTLCKALARFGVRFDREFARGTIDISTDRNHRPMPVSPDLFVVIESAARAKLDFSKFEVPTVFVVGDPYIGFEDHVRDVGIEDYDYVFISQHDCVDKYKEAGCANVQWLPFACDPDLNGRVNVPLQYDVCFVGSIHPKWGAERKRILQLINRNFKNTWIGQSYGPKVTQLYSGSKIVFNKSILGEMNMRVFEGLASGSLLMTDRIKNGLLDLFAEKQDLVCYQTDDELISAIGYYLEHSEERENIAQHGYRTVMGGHTYAHRAAQILSTVAT